MSLRLHTPAFAQDCHHPARAPGSIESTSSSLRRQAMPNAANTFVTFVRLVLILLFVPCWVLTTVSARPARLLSAPYTTNEFYALHYATPREKFTNNVVLKMGKNTQTVSVPNDTGSLVPVTFDITRVESMLDRTYVGYDALDNPEWITNALGQVTHLKHDGLGRLVEVDGPELSDTIRYAYDGNDNLIQMEDPTGVTVYEYDQFDRLTLITLASGRGSIGYTYDRADRITRLTYPNGIVVNYRYDVIGRLETVSQGTNVTIYGYYPDGLLKSVRLPNGITSAYIYDRFARLTDLVYTNALGHLLTSFHYTMDNNGNRTRVEEVRYQTHTIGDPMNLVTNVYSYAYDTRNQLIQAGYPKGNVVSYNYDSNGNRLSVATDADGAGPLTPVIEYYNYGMDNRLEAITAANGATIERFHYDPMGNVIARITPAETIQYRHDRRNLVLEVSNGTDLIQYEYDGNGNRTARSVNGLHTAYVNDPNRSFTQTIMELNESGEAQTHIFGLGRISVALKENNSTSYYIADALGSTTHLADSVGRFVRSYDYTAFGDPEVLTEGEEKPDSNEYKFTGERFDSLTGLVYLRAREYDPRIGRFVTKDGAGFVGGPNLYIYAGNNPVNRTDPSGTDWRFPNEALPEVARIWYDAVSKSVSSVSLGTKLIFKGVQEVFKRVPQRWLETPYLTGGRGLRPEYFSGAKLAKEWVGKVSKPLGWIDYGLKIGDYWDVSKRWAAGRASFGELAISGSRAVIETVLLPLKAAYGLSVAVGKVVGTAGGNALPLPPESLLRDSSLFSLRRPERGGVLLNRAVDFVGDLSAITGVTVDPQTGEVLLLGTAAVGTVPELQLADFVSAVRAVFGSAEDPGVTIDPQRGFESNPNVAQIVHLFAGLEDTDMGWVLLEADRVMKTLAAEKDNVLGFPVSSSVPGYKSMLQRWVEAGVGGGIPQSSRFWFVPSDVRLVRSADTNSFVFDRTAVQLLTESVYDGKGVTDTNAQAFAEWFTTNYDAIAKEEYAVYRYPGEGLETEGPFSMRIFQRLEQVAKAIAFARFLYDNRIPIDFSWIEKVELPKVNTPTFVNTVQNERFSEGPGGLTRIVIFGGVTLETPNTYLFDSGVALDMRTNVLNSRPDRLSQSWKVNFNGQPQTAVALSLNTQNLDGLHSRTDTDLLYKSSGNVPFGLTRYYRSSEPLSGAFGHGWEFLPFDVEFTRPEFFSSSRSLFTFLNGLHEDEIRIVDRAGGGMTTFLSTLETERLAGFFFYGGLNDKWVPDFRRGGSEAPDGSSLVQNPDDLSYYWSLPDGSRIAFDQKGRMLQARDNRGHAVLYNYDTNGLVKSIQDPIGQVITLTYDASNRVSQASGLGGDMVTYAYDSRGDLTSVMRTRQGEAITTTYQYDTNHVLTKISLPDKVVDTEQLYDIMGRATVRRDSRGNQFKSDFDQANGRTVITDMTNGVSSVKEQDFMGRPTLLVDALGRETRYYYHSFTRRQPDVVQLPDPNRPLIFFRYDENGNVTEIADPVRGGDSDGNGLDDNPIKMAYDASNNLVEVIDARRIVTRFAYNAFNQPTLMTRAWGTSIEATTTWNYDPSTGFLTSQRDPTGVETKFEYDTLGNLVRQIIAPGTSTATTNHFFYDEFSRRIGHEDGLGRTTRTIFNGRDQVASVRIGGSPALVSTNLFDPVSGRLLAEVDFNGNTNRFSYDPVTGDILALSESGSETALVYDRFGNLSSIIDPVGNVTDFIYDVLQRQIGIVSRGAQIQSSAPLAISEFAVSANTLQMTIRSSLPGDVVSVEQTTDVATLSWVPSASAIVTPAEANTWTVSIPKPTTARVFYRVKLTSNSQTPNRSSVQISLGE